MWDTVMLRVAAMLAARNDQRRTARGTRVHAPFYESMLLAVCAKSGFPLILRFFLSGLCFLVFSLTFWLLRLDIRIFAPW